MHKPGAELLPQGGARLCRAGDSEAKAGGAKSVDRCGTPPLILMNRIFDAAALSLEWLPGSRAASLYLRLDGVSPHPGISSSAAALSNDLSRLSERGVEFADVLAATAGEVRFAAAFA